MLTLTSQSASAALIQYTDRPTWLAAVGSVFTEDFESDTGGFTNIQTPFATANGFILNGVSSQFNSMQILPSGQFTVLANGTQFLHFRDFAAGLLITFPTSASAFGFDYGTSDAGWTLSAANGVNFIFPSGPDSAGFIGFVEDTGSAFPSFTLTGPCCVQRGLSIDNISIVAVPEPATLALFCAGLAALLGATRQRKVTI